MKSFNKVVKSGIVVKTEGTKFNVRHIFTKNVLQFLFISAHDQIQPKCIS